MFSPSQSAHPVLLNQPISVLWKWPSRNTVSRTVIITLEGKINTEIKLWYSHYKLWFCQPWCNVMQHWVKHCHHRLCIIVSTVLGKTNGKESSSVLLFQQFWKILVTGCSRSDAQGTLFCRALLMQKCWIYMQVFISFLSICVLKLASSLAHIWIKVVLS